MKKKDKDVRKKGVKHSDTDFPGYTIEELRYQLAITAVKKEFLKEKAMETAEAMKKQLNSKMPIVGGGSKGLFGKLMKGLDLADYLLLGYQGFRLFRKVGSVFRKR